MTEFWGASALVEVGQKTWPTNKIPNQKSWRWSTSTTCLHCGCRWRARPRVHWRSLPSIIIMRIMMVCQVYVVLFGSSGEQLDFPFPPHLWSFFFWHNLVKSWHFRIASPTLYHPGELLWSPQRPIQRYIIAHSILSFLVHGCTHAGISQASLHVHRSHPLPRVCGGGDVLQLEDGGTSPHTHGVGGTYVQRSNWLIAGMKWDRKTRGGVCEVPKETKQAMFSEFSSRKRTPGSK